MGRSADIQVAPVMETLMGTCAESSSAGMARGACAAASDFGTLETCAAGGPGYRFDWNDFLTFADRLAAAFSVTSSSTTAKPCSLNKRYNSQLEMPRTCAPNPEETFPCL